MANNLTLTTAGQERLTSALLDGIRFRISSMAIGAAAAALLTPSSSAIGSELLRVPIDKQVTVGNQSTFEAAISEDKGPFTIRAIGLYDDTNSLFAYGALPDIYKPGIVENYGQAIRIKATLTLASSAEISTIIVSQAPVANSLENIGNIGAVGLDLARSVDQKSAQDAIGLSMDSIAIATEQILTDENNEMLTDENGEILYA